MLFLWHLAFHFANWPRWSENADFQSIFARSASAITPSEKSSINTNRKSTTRFRMSLIWTSYVTAKFSKSGSKTQKGRFPSKLHFGWRESATNFLSVKTVSDKLIRHSLAYPCKKDWWGIVSSTWKVGGYWHTPLQNADFPSIVTRTCSVSAVSPSKKVQLTLLGSALHAFQWA